MEKVMVALTTPMFEHLASELRHSMAGLGTREKVLIEILCPATNFEIQNIKSAYQARE
jgi:Annexin